MKHLKSHKRHRLLLILLSNNHVGKDRQDISRDEVWTSRDFAARLQLKYNSQTQQEYYGQGVSVSLEGVAVKHLDDKGKEQHMEFHSFLSSHTNQDAGVVRSHLQKLLEHLQSNKVIKKGTTVMCNTNGCAAQYRCGTAFHFMTSLACQFEINISRAICCPGHK